MQQLKSGVYQIRNLINGKRYIGSSLNILRRWKQHKQKLKSKKHHSTYLQNAVNKYGIDNFIIETIGLCPEEYMLKLEQWCLDKLKPEYNICTSVSGGTERKMKEETKQKISVSNKGKSHISPIKNKSLSDEHKRKLSLLKQTPILQYNLEGNFIKEWNSVQEAIKNTGLKHIADCLLGRCKRCGKYIWRKKTPKYIDDHSRIIPLYLLEDLSIYKKKTRLTSTKQPSEKLKQALDKAHAKNKKKIDQFSLDGVFLKTWDSISEAAMRYGVSIGAISSCLNGRNNTCVKCIWKYNLQSGNK